MPGDDLDDIRALIDCPACGAGFTISRRTMRLARTIECPGCGATVRPIDDTPIAAVQKLINDAGDQQAG